MRDWARHRSISASTAKASIAVTSSAVKVVLCTAVAYIQAGTGGIVPFLMITVGPVLAGVYVYYFGFRKFEAPADS